MSVRASTGLPSTCSGATYLAVPTMSPGWVRSASATALAIPKSATLIRPSPASRTLAGLTSRWTSPGPVGRLERLGDLGREARGLPRVDRRRIVEPLPQRLARHELHHDGLRAGLRAGVVDRHDPRVGEPGGGHRLLAEPQHEAVVGGEVRVEHLHRDLAAQHLVRAPPHLRHAARRDQLLEAVALGRATDLPRRGVLGTGRRSRACRVAAWGSTQRAEATRGLWRGSHARSRRSARGDPADAHDPRPAVGADHRADVAHPDLVARVERREEVEHLGLLRAPARGSRTGARWCRPRPPCRGAPRAPSCGCGPCRPPRPCRWRCRRWA